MKNRLLLSIIGIGVLLTACELDRIPETSFSDANFWKTEKDLKEACNYLYSRLTGISTADNMSDDTFGSGPNSVSDGSRITPNSSSDWSGPYATVRAANNILEKSSTMKLDPSVLCKYKAEVKFFRAWAYFDLVKKYGDVPLILKTLGIDSPELTMPRTVKATVIDTIYADLDYAANYLPAASKIGKGVDYGRLSQSAAWALKSSVALYVGTHQKFHGYGDPSVHLQLAIAAAENVMGAGHKLYSAKGANSYYSLFRYDGEGSSNTENILVKIYGQNKANNILSHNFSRNQEQGAMSATRSLIESYLCVDGLPADKSPLAEKVEVNSKSIFTNKDPRLNATIYKSGDGNWLSSGAAYSPSISFVKTGFAGKKYVEQQDWIDQVSFIDYILIRYAEVLLNYAEAKFELNGAITNEELNKSINLTRTRAGMPNLTNEFVTANGLDMRTEIRRERRVELALEGYRYDDIIRWKIAEQVLPQAVVGAKYFASEYANVKNPVLTPEGYFVVQPKEKRTFNTGRDYLYPIPIREIALTSGAIVQNPNW